MRLTWPHVAIVAIIVTGVVILGAIGRDTTALIGLGLAVLVGLGLVAGQQSEIKSAANGTMSRLVQLVEAMAAQLRQMPPGPNEDPRSDRSEQQRGQG